MKEQEVIETNSNANTEASRELSNSANREGRLLTGDDLLNVDIAEIPFLWNPFFPQVGLVAITGASECGKSSLLRHLSIAICNGDNEFLGSSITHRHNKVLNVITEDSDIAIAVNLKRQAGEAASNLKNMFFLFNSNTPISSIKAFLDNQAVDLVIIDVWSDTIDFSANEMYKVRMNLRQYSDLANEFQTCICIIHHNVKRSEEKEPSKNNVNGSQAIEAKTRSVLELRMMSDTERQLSIVKSNYVQPEIKRLRWMLKVDENLQYSLNAVSEEEQYVKYSKMRKSNNEELVNHAKELYSSGKYSQDQVLVQLEDKYGNLAPSKGTLNKWLQGIEKNNQE